MKSSHRKLLILVISIFALTPVCLGQYVGLTVEGPSINLSEDSASLAINSQHVISGEIGNLIVPDLLYLDGRSIDSKLGDLRIHANTMNDVELVEGGGRVWIDSNEDVRLFPNYQRGSLMIGDLNNLNLGIDGNEIMARNSDGTSTLFLQADGGDLSVGDDEGPHIVFNGREILAMQDDTTATLFVQPIGGDVNIGSGLGGSTEVYIHALSGIGTADVHADANGKLMRSLSDIRLKEDIKPIEAALDRITRLQGVSYTWKERSGHDRTYGLIAQDVMKILPDIVTSDGTYYGINYSELPALLIEAIKEQQELINMQKEEIETLKKRMARLEELTN